MTAFESVDNQAAIEYLGAFGYPSRPKPTWGEVRVPAAEALAEEGV